MWSIIMGVAFQIISGVVSKIWAWSSRSCWHVNFILPEGQRPTQAKYWSGHGLTASYRPNTMESPNSGHQWDPPVCPL